jgi:asparagine synthase (glutamine-hydrolysing)
MGFPVPVAAWLRGPQGAEALAVLREPGSPVAAWADRRRTVWLMDRHRAGRLDYSQSLWTLLVLEHWARRWREERAAARRATAAALST